MNQPDVKSEARRLIDQLADDATWDDLMYELYVRQPIEAGCRDSQVDRVVDVEQLREQYGLPK